MARNLRWLGWLGRGVRRDLAGRVPAYWSDWSQARRGKLRVLAAATYIFCASAIPALAFGEQLYAETAGALSAVQVLAATATTGLAQALVGGQPLLIVGVAEPIVLVYSYMYRFAEVQDGLGPALFLPWCAWTCVWAALMILALAAANSCAYISRFTRFAGELFGALIALLFIQQAVKGSVEEFRAAPEGSVETGAGGASWQLVNGLWSLLLAFGLLLSSLLLRRARSWRFLRSPLRAFLADYGAALMLVAFTGLSFAVRGGGWVPRRVHSPNTWAVKDSWTVAGDMGRVGGRWIAAALVPAALIAILFFFDHNVSAQLAQQEEFNLRKSPAYHYDFLLLGLMTLLCGLLGLPPVNGVLPQSPMHTKALARVSGKRSGGEVQHAQEGGGQLPAAAGVGLGASGSRCSGDGGSDTGTPVGLEGQAAAGGGGGVFASPSKQALLRTADDSARASPPAPARAARHAQPRVPASTLPAHAAAAPDGGSGAGAGSSGSGGGDVVVAVAVLEQRVSGLLQSLGVAACLAAMPAIRQIPTAVLWGYFAFMALESLPGSQLWDRSLLLLTDPRRRARLLERGHAAYLETVPFRTIAAFTAFQLACLAAVYAVTWAGVAGILFPLPIMALVPLRQWAMPRFFRDRRHLQELDAAHEEEAAPLPHEEALQEAAAQGLVAALLVPPTPPGGLPGGGGEVPEGELLHLRLVHQLSRESLIRRRHSLSAEPQLAAAAAVAATAGAAAPRDAAAAPAGPARLPGTAPEPASPRAAAQLRRRSHELAHV